jgi:hypothetical protein
MSGSAVTASGRLRNSSFTLAAVTTLALGVGVTTAVFSVVNTVLLQQLPFQDSDRLVRIVARCAENRRRRDVDSLFTCARRASCPRLMRAWFR